MPLPQALYYAAQIHAADRRAIAQQGMGAAELMERAGQAAFLLLRRRWPRARRIAVVCGPGNNGGDGYVVARRAHAAGLTPVVLRFDERRLVAGDAGIAAQRLAATGIEVQPFSAAALQGCDVIVDGVFGIGLARAVSGQAQAMIAAMNRSGLPQLALDVPSGLHADTGCVLGIAVQATATLTFIGLKPGLFTGAGREYVGELYFDDLNLPAAVFQDVAPPALRITAPDMHGLLPRRARHSHKGDAGRMLLVGGAPGMGGALRLAGIAALRTGAGRVTLATHALHAPHLSCDCPELMVHGIAAAQELRSLITPAVVIAAGPGLGQDPWAQNLWAALLESPQLGVVDADALNLLAHDPVRRDDWILTPHVGEAARLLACTTEDIQHDRLSAARNIAARYGGVCVLKGSGTLIAQHGAGPVWLCDRGNPGLACAGSGDVLTGVIAALRAQGLNPLDAARLGVWLHASAGDKAVLAGEIGMLASDLFPYLRAGINEITDPCV